MKISFNELKNWLPGLKMNVTEVAELLVRRGLEVEEISDLSAGFSNVVTAKILEKTQHPQADRLSLCRVNDGQGVREIVCGAQNMKAGDHVVLAKPGAYLPNGVKIQESKIRGQLSQGMLCSLDELGLGDGKSEGIIILAADIELGVPAAEVFFRNDTILTLKITPNRGDCLSYLGIAREVAADSSSLGVKVQFPFSRDFSEDLNRYKPLSDREIALATPQALDSPQFVGAKIEGVKIGPSPDWLKNKLEGIGQRSINNVVDATNWVMFELGHPVHAYDADKLEGSVIGVREAVGGEKIKLLDETEILCLAGDLLIFDGNLQKPRPIGLAGVMGGFSTEVSQSTVNLFLEVAQFSAQKIRKTSTRLQKKSEASYRFERQIDPMGLQRVMSRLIDLVVECSGGKCVGVLHQKRETHLESKEIVISPSWVRNFLGMEISDERMLEEWSRLGMKVVTGKEWRVSFPSYRNDLHIPQDLAEEIARAVGYDHLPATMPSTTTLPPALHGDENSGFQKNIYRAKQLFAAQGLLESVHFGFGSPEWLSQLGFDSNSGIGLANPLSVEESVLVPSLLPSLLKAYLKNQNHHFGSNPLSVRLFELRPVFSGKSALQGKTDTGVNETLHLGVLMSGPKNAAFLKADQEQIDFFDLKGVFESVFQQLGVRGFRWTSPNDDIGTRKTPDGQRDHSFLYHPGQKVTVILGNRSIGSIGRLHPQLERRLKFRQEVWIGEIDFQQVLAMTPQPEVPRRFKMWSETPGIERDFALVVDRGVSAEKLIQIASKAGKPLAKLVNVFDIYEGAQVGGAASGKKSVALRIVFGDDSRSLTEAEIEPVCKQLVLAWQKEAQAELRK